MAESELIERLENGSGPDRELDARLFAEQDGRDVVVKSSATWRDALFGRARRPPHDECYLYTPHTAHAWDGLPRYTASLDAALGFAKAIGCPVWLIEWNGDGRVEATAGPDGTFASALDAPRAILVAAIQTAHGLNLPDEGERG